MKTSQLLGPCHKNLQGQKYENLINLMATINGLKYMRLNEKVITSKFARG